MDVLCGDDEGGLFCGDGCEFDDVCVGVDFEIKFGLFEGVCVVCFGCMIVCVLMSVMLEWL